MVVKRAIKKGMDLDTYQLLGSFLQCIQSQHVGYNEKYREYLSDDCSKDIKEYINDPRHTIYVFLNERTEEIGGMSIVRKDKGGYHIVELYICPKYRGKGIAKKFLKMILRKCEKSATLRVHLKNSRAISLYKSLGFEWLDKQSCPLGSRRMIYKVKGAENNAKNSN